MTLDQIFLDYSVRKLRQNVDRIEKCLARLSDDQLWLREHESENAVGNLLLHLAGNIRQWILSGVGGVPDTRDRDSEFNAQQGPAGPELLVALRATVENACQVIQPLSPERLSSIIHVQKYDLSVLEAIYHVVEHFAQHTGQIIFATKMLTGEELGFYNHLKQPAHREKTP